LNLELYTVHTKEKKQILCIETYRDRRVHSKPTHVNRTHTLTERESIQRTFHSLSMQFFSLRNTVRALPSRNPVAFLPALFAAVLLLAVHPFANGALVLNDPDGEPGWGHVYISGGVVSYEFFRAKFGGKFSCDLTGFPVVQLGLGCELLSGKDADNAKGKIAMAARGNCSFNDKAIVAEKAGAVGLIVVNNQPGLLRMPAGVIKMKEGFDVTIPVVMLKDTDGSAVANITSQNNDNLVRVVGESLVKGTVRLAGRCIEAMEIGADGNPVVPTEPAKEIEGGTVRVFPSASGDGSQEYEFLTAMFGAPVNTKQMSYAFGEPVEGCSEFTNAADVKGKVAVLRRGACMFANKAHHAQAAGAAGVVIVNTENGLSRMFGGDTKSNFVTIPVAMVSKDCGEELEAAKGEGLLRMAPTAVKANLWDQAARFCKRMNWPEDDEQREDLYNQLKKKHDPELTEEGGPERMRIIEKAYNEANEYFEETSAVV
jgi:hypothetical protein